MRKTRIWEHIARTFSWPRNKTAKPSVRQPGASGSRTWKCLGADKTRALPPEGPRRRHSHPLPPIAASASPPAPPPSGVTAIIVTWADVRSRDRGMRETSHSQAPARVMAGTEAGDSSGRLAAAHPRDRERPPPPGSPTHHRGRRRRRGRTAEPVSLRSQGGGRAGGGTGAVPLKRPPGPASLPSGGAAAVPAAAAPLRRRPPFCGSTGSSEGPPQAQSRFS